MSEHSEQVSLFKWIDIKLKSDERYKNIYAVPNGGLRNKITAAKLKREGVRPGVLDINVDWPSKGYHGLRIEMKFGRNKPTDNQIKWINQYKKAGYMTHVSYNWINAKDIIEWYFNSKQII